MGTKPLSHVHAASQGNYAIVCRDEPRGPTIACSCFVRQRKSAPIGIDADFAVIEDVAGADDVAFICHGMETDSAPALVLRS